MKIWEITFVLTNAATSTWTVAAANLEAAIYTAKKKHSGIHGWSGEPRSWKEVGR